MKKIGIIILTILCIYLIYYGLYKNKINYVSISDNSINIDGYNYNDYLKDYLERRNKLNEYNISFINNSVSKVHNDILNNRTIRINNHDYYFKKVLRESDLVVINVGMEEIANNFNSDFFSFMYFNIEKLVSEVVKYAKGKIIFLGYYNPTNYYDAKIDEYYYNMDIKLNSLMQKYGISYIDLYTIVKSTHHNSSFINTTIHQKIASILEFYLE